ncbi:hypothetical protein GCM10010502_52210 [Kitasatospora aureofaciens]|uniref:Secreted protein n=1 Tax=Kitasatospora aureofaciens TaxID=1894 RepID=A0A8H9HXQ2_KITAU|nr:hypothetical protein GCM10010502_52210 [Kitasatospora aureofaciens]
MVRAMYAMLALSGLSASQATSQTPLVASVVILNCWLMPMTARAVCSVRVSPDGRGVAEVAASADRVMHT